MNVKLLIDHLTEFLAEMHGCPAQSNPDARCPFPDECGQDRDVAACWFAWAQEEYTRDILKEAETLKEDAERAERTRVEMGL
jgi:hypothetical protein